MIEKGVFIREELLGIKDLADQKRKEEGGASSVIQRKLTLQEASRGHGWREVRSG
jgi:hypothetical protein